MKQAIELSRGQILRYLQGVFRDTTAGESGSYVFIGPATLEPMTSLVIGRILTMSAVATAVTFSSATAAHAAFFQNTTGLNGTTSIITFDEILLPNLTQVTTQYDSLGVSFSPFAFYFAESANGLSAVSNFVPNGFGGSRFVVDVIFSDPVTEAALQAFGPGTATFTAFLGGSQVESASAALGSGDYYGFSGVLFDSISINPYNPADDIFGLGWRSPLILDNIQRRAEVTPPPTSQVPGPLPLLGVGAAFGYSRTLRKRIKINKAPEVMSAIG